MATGDHYIPDLPGMGAYLRSAEVRALLHREGGRGQSYAGAVAPHRSGDYAASLDLSDSHAWDGRAAVDLVANIDYGDAVEYHHHVLARTSQIIEAGG